MARTRTSGIRRLNRVKGTVYEVRFRDGEGRQRSRTFETKDEARAFQSAVLADLREGTYVAPSAGAVPFRVVAEQWFAAQLQLKRRTQITYRSAIDHNLAPLHDKPVGRIAFAHVQAIVNDMVAAGRRPSTVRNVLMVCRLILDEAVRRKLIRTNPCRDVKPPRLRPPLASEYDAATIRGGLSTKVGGCGMAVTKVPSYQVKITLVDVKPPVWRRLVLPGQWHLGRVHTALQIAMGWTNSHLHEFETADGSRYGVPDPDWGMAEVRRETTARLHEVAPDVGAWLHYTYDFGDNWRHDIVVEALGEPTRQASCLAGKRACPPEDCGGAWGYPEMLAAVADPAHPEHETYAEWLDENFDPEAFDVHTTDRILRTIP